MSRISVASLAIACLLTGYGLNGGRVRAAADDVNQARQLPGSVSVGDRVTLTFVVNSFGNSPSPLDCTIAEVSGGWVRCAPNDPSRNGQPLPIFAAPGIVSGTDRVVWYDLSRVVAVEKVKK
jgi:hypothetical protein